VRKTGVVLVILLLPNLVVLGWLGLLQLDVASSRDRIGALEMVSPGMTREEVTTRMGNPSYSLRKDNRINTESEVLVYKSWRHTRADIMVVLDSNGRVVTTFHPGWHFPPTGGIAPGGGQELEAVPAVAPRARRQ
jgi:hypothetical protein